MNAGAPALQALERDELLARVEALRSRSVGPANAAPHPDPMRLHYIEALARRLRAAPPAVQAVLQLKLAEALRALGGGVPAGTVDQEAPKQVESEARAVPSVRSESVEAPTEKPTPRKPRTHAPQPEAERSKVPLSLLGQLNQHIQAASSSADPAVRNAAPKTLTPTRSPDLKSAVRFRETWARISAETAVDQAKHRAPENAGPLNAHNLVLRTLGLMRELSPDYLRHFLSHAESLMWLDQAHGQLKQPAVKLKLAKSPKLKK